MLTFPLIYPPRPRRRGSRAKTPAAPPTPAALTLLAVESLAVIGPEIEMNLVFDVGGGAGDTLNDVSAADPAKWSARYQGQRYVGIVLSNILPDTLYLSMSATGAEAGADVLSYANAPSDISDSLGRFLAAFAGFPR